MEAYEERHVNPDDRGGEPGLTKRRYTGASRGDATAGFKLDWPGLSRRYLLVAEAWDEDTHTLTVMLRPLAAEPPAAGPGPVRAAGAGDPARPPFERGAQLTDG